MELTWFRTPTADRPGALNLCFNALDRHVVAGRADERALVEAGRETTYAVLLERVAALAGGLRAAGVEPGQRVAIHLDGGYDAVLVVLAAARLGAVTGDVERPDVLVTDRPDAPGAPFRLLRGVEPTGPTDLTWDVVAGAGRHDPAPCAELAGDAPAYVVAGRTISAADGATDDSPTGRLLATLCDGGTVEL